MTKVLFTTDIHGSEICFKKFVASAKFYKADVIIMGGDCTGKMLVPIIAEDGGEYTSRYLNRDWQFSEEDELNEFERKVKNTGYYPVRLSQNEYQELQADPKKVDSLFVDTMVRTLENWLDYAEEKLKGTGVRCIITPGNDDDFVVDEVLEKNSFVVAGEEQVVSLDDHHEILSLGWSNPTPWDTPRECSEEKLSVKIEMLAKKVHDMERAVFNLHAPPYGSGLDVAPEMDKNLSPKRGGTIMVSTGSTAVRDAIRKYKPLVGLHGHIHEARGFQRIGGTLCINPGSSYGEGSLNGVLFDLRKNSVESYVMTMG